MEPASVWCTYYLNGDFMNNCEKLSPRQQSLFSSFSGIALVTEPMPFPLPLMVQVTHYETSILHMGVPARHGGTPSSLDGVFHGNSHSNG